jgi:hypothetical protein
MTRRRPSLTLASLVLTCLLAVPVVDARAWELQGVKSITATTRDNQRITLGSVRFEPRDDGSVAFSVSLEPARFTDHFLSMKEFKCLDGPGEVVCHVPYPHAQPGTITADDLAWLEHNLLFLYQLPTDFGAKLWNGLYFQLEPTEQGLRGRPQAIDLNYISAPSDTPEQPPYQPAQRDEIAPGVRWIQSLSIE